MPMNLQTSQTITDQTSTDTAMLMSIDAYMDLHRTRDASDQLVSGRYNARCKSGYTFGQANRPCKRMASRGMLMCNECLRTTPQWPAWLGQAVQAGRAGGRQDVLARVLMVASVVVSMALVLIGQGVSE